MYDVNYKNVVEQLKVKLMEFINTAAFVTAQDLMEEFDLPRNKVEKYLDGFINKGFVVRSQRRVRCVNTPRAVYTFTGTGQPYIAKVYGTDDYVKTLSDEGKKLYIQAKQEYQMAKEDNQSEMSKQTVVKVNATTTLYLNSNKPAGWYSWQKTKRNTSTSIASTFSLI